MHIERIVQHAHAMAAEKGWWENERNGLEIAALVHAEVSEMVEAIRKTAPDGSPMMSEKLPHLPAELEEMADVVIRLADYAGHKGYDLAGAIEAKMEYNATRPHRHGGKAY